MVAQVRHQHTVVGQHSETTRLFELRLRRSAVPVPSPAVARHRTHLLQVGAQHVDAVVQRVRHQHTAVGQHGEISNIMAEFFSFYNDGIRHKGTIVSFCIYTLYLEF